MQCLHNVPYASWRLTVFRQLFTSSQPTRLSSSPRRTISSTTTQSQAQHRQKDTAQTEKPNNDKPETSTPRPSDQLPQSPLLTSPHIRPVTKHRKRPPTAEEVNILRKNPWAQALASPLRMCCLTGARIPRDLLTTWGLVQRPESKGLWFLPVDLLKDELRGQESPSPKGQKKPSHSNSLQHVSVRMIDSIQLVRRLTKSLASHAIGNFSALSKTIPYRMKHPQGPFTASHARALVWRQDMPEFVLRRMRLEAVKRLKKVLGHENGVWRAVDIDGEVSEDALRKGLEGMAAFERMECGSVLVMREPQSEEHAADALPELVALPQTGSRVPVFDLSGLLSESEREELRRADPKFERACLFFRPDDSAAIDAMMALWKLRGFVNEELRFH